MFDLIEIAASNGKVLEHRFKLLKSNMAPDTAVSLQSFADFVFSDGRVAMNMRPMPLMSFLVFGLHQNLYEWARARAEESSRPVEDLIRERLGDYYSRRTTFDRHFKNGEALRYGALNAGGLGVRLYGDYCVVLHIRQFEQSNVVAYLRSDSLKTYLLPSGLVDDASLQRDATPHSHRHIFAAIKYEPKITPSEEVLWPTLLCSDADFIEAVFLAQVTPVEVESIRIEKRQYQELFHYAYQNLREKLTDERRNLVEAFVLIKRLMRQNNIPLEVTDNA